MKRSAIAALIGLAVLRPGASSATEIRMFDDMALQDQQAYVKYLAKTTEEILIEENQQDQAVKVRQLFQKIPKGERRSIGEVQFEANLAEMRSALRDGAPFASKAEDAMTVTLVKSGVQLPMKFFNALRERLREKPFWPKLPMRTR